MIKFGCLGCGTKLTVKDDAAGKRAKCRKCGAILTIPAANASNGAPGSAPKPQPAAPAARQAAPPSAAGQFSLAELAEQCDVDVSVPAPTPIRPPTPAPPLRRSAPADCAQGNPHADSAKKWAVRALIVLVVAIIAFFVVRVAVAVTVAPKSMREALDPAKMVRFNRIMGNVRVGDAVLAGVCALSGLAALIFGILGVAVSGKRQGKGRAIFGIVTGGLCVAISVGAQLMPAARHDAPTPDSAPPAVSLPPAVSSPAAVSSPPLSRPSQTVALNPKDEPVLVENLLRQSKEMADASVRGDNNRSLDYMFPNLIAVAGGREAMLAQLKTMQSHVEVVSSTVGQPSQIVQSGKYVFALVPTVNVSRRRGAIQTITLNGSLLAASTDHGVTWKFIDGGVMQMPGMLDRVLPEAVGVFSGATATPAAPQSKPAGKSSLPVQPSP